eukprot:TRINITY_DN9068_c0_g1_i1.p1 TRINITY_DN9068_c0_g1~~TRINITY_DN9068_c0_g1_i1.p1  ORF type:complete len:658 (-),score=115.03 TRINITY_DN9068_c0_g1_i1:211-2184(-)
MVVRLRSAVAMLLALRGASAEDSRGLRKLQAACSETEGTLLSATYPCACGQKTCITGEGYCQLSTESCWSEPVASGPVPAPAVMTPAATPTPPEPAAEGTAVVPAPAPAPAAGTAETTKVQFPLSVQTAAVCADIVVGQPMYEAMQGVGAVIAGVSASTVTVSCSTARRLGPGRRLENALPLTFDVFAPTSQAPAIKQAIEAAEPAAVQAEVNKAVTGKSTVTAPLPAVTVTPAAVTAMKEAVATEATPVTPATPATPTTPVTPATPVATPEPVVASPTAAPTASMYYRRFHMVVEGLAYEYLTEEEKRTLSTEYADSLARNLNPALSPTTSFQNMTGVAGRCTIAASANCYYQTNVDCIYGVAGDIYEAITTQLGTNPNEDLDKELQLSTKSALESSLSALVTQDKHYRFLNFTKATNKDTALWTTLPTCTGATAVPTAAPVVWTPPKKKPEKDNTLLYLGLILLAMLAVAGCAFLAYRMSKKPAKEPLKQRRPQIQHSAAPEPEAPLLSQLEELPPPEPSPPMSFRGVEMLSPVPAPPLPQVQCVCGNFFMDDSNFCRKCGRPRNMGNVAMAQRSIIQPQATVLPTYAPVAMPQPVQIVEVIQPQPLIEVVQQQPIPFQVAAPVPTYSAPMVSSPMQVGPIQTTAAFPATAYTLP